MSGPLVQLTVRHSHFSENTGRSASGLRRRLAVQAGL
jgi:hypothetical protein